MHVDRVGVVCKTSYIHCKSIPSVFFVIKRKENSKDRNVYTTRTKHYIISGLIREFSCH